MAKNKFIEMLKKNWLGGVIGAGILFWGAGWDVRPSWSSSFYFIYGVLFSILSPLFEILGEGYGFMLYISYVLIGYIVGAWVQNTFFRKK